MRRLPIYFVLDCSEYMAGEKLKKVESGVSLIIQQLKKDPQALETVYFSIITFAGISRTLSPLLEISYFYPPKLPLGGGTSLGLALNNLMKDIDSNTIKSTIDKKVGKKRGKYKFETEVLVEDVSNLKEGELTRLYRDKLEETIRQNPDNYLWSHRRWKLIYKSDYEEKWIDTTPRPIVLDDKS